MSEHGNIGVMTLGLHETAGFCSALCLLESIAPGSMPNGLLNYRIDGVQAGDSFAIAADDGQETLFPGCDPAKDLGCLPYPDFDCSMCGNRPGNEEGTVPESGACIVYLVFGDPGEGFTYAEQ